MKTAPIIRECLHPQKISGPTVTNAFLALGGHIPPAQPPCEAAVSDGRVQSRTRQQCQGFYRLDSRYHFLFPFTSQCLKTAGKSTTFHFCVAPVVSGPSAQMTLNSNPLSLLCTVLFSEIFASPPKVLGDQNPRIFISHTSPNTRNSFCKRYYTSISNPGFTFVFKTENETKCGLLATLKSQTSL